MTDKTLQTAIMDELEWDPSVNSAHIGVTADNGVVTLNGIVDSYAAKLAAERVVGRVAGVKGVAEELEVKIPSVTRYDDGDIAKRALQMISWNVNVPPDSIKVKVQNGWVTLSGELDWQYQRSAAARHIMELHGVKGLMNEIKIRPRLAPADVREKITDALARNAQVEAKGISVAVDGGKVTLSGTVPRWADRYLVEHAAWSATGVSDVDDRLTVA